MHLYRYAASVVLYGTGTIFFQFHPDLRAETGQMFIYRIVNDLIDQMVQSLGSNAAYVHTRTLADGF